MRTTARLLTAVSLLLMGSLAMPVAAAVTQLPQPDWTAAYDAALATSGAFAPGSTVVVVSRTEATSTSLMLTVNPDGSLRGERTSPDGMERIRCVRVDRCWEQSAMGYGNARWHRLPPGSVTYLPSTQYWWDVVMDMPWPDSAVYFTDVTEGGVTMYGVGTGDEYNATFTTVSFGESTSTAVHMVVLGGTPMFTTLTVAGPAAATPITPPPKPTIGKPAQVSNYWSVPISSG